MYFNRKNTEQKNWRMVKLILHLRKQFLRPLRNQLQLLLQLWNQALQLKGS